MSIEIVSTSVGADGQLVHEVTSAAAAKAAGNVPDASAAEEKVEAADAEVDKVEDQVEQAEDAEPKDESVEDESEQEDAEKAPKKKSGFEKRIEKLNKRATAAERRTAELEAKLAAFEQPQQAEAPVDDGLKQPKAEDYDSNADYVEALFEHSRMKAELKAQREQANAYVKAEVAALEQKFKQANEIGADKYDDFEDVADVSDLGVVPTGTFMQFFRELETPELQADLIYYLGSNREEFVKVLGLGDTIAAVKALARIEDKILSNATAKKNTAVKPTKAPKPVSTVSGSRASRVSEITDNMSADEYRAARMAQLRSKGR